MTGPERLYPPLEAGLNEYRGRRIDWHAYEENKLVTSDLKLVLREFDSETGPCPTEGFMIFEMLREVKDFVSRIKILLFAERYFDDPTLLAAWKAQGRPFLELLLIDSADLDLEAYQKCKILITLSLSHVQEATESMLSFLKHCCSGSDKDALLLGSLWLQFYLEVAENRTTFIKERIDFVLLLVRQLRTVKNNQIQYQMIFCVWILTFEKHNCQAMLQIGDIVPIMIEVAKAAVKEKIIRLVVASFINFMRLCDKQAIPLFVGSKVSPFIETLVSRTYTDEEFRADIVALAEELKSAIQHLSTFDEYVSEIKSGQLEWSPPHKSDLFWNDNASRFDENDLEVLRHLAVILSESEDPQKLAIACFDVGQYIEYHAAGKRNIDKLGIKQEVMKLIAHQDSEVRYYALSAVQKYMANLWSAI